MPRGAIICSAALHLQPPGDSRPHPLTSHPLPSSFHPPATSLPLMVPPTPHPLELPLFFLPLPPPGPHPLAPDDRKIRRCRSQGRTEFQSNPTNSIGSNQTETHTHTRVSVDKQGKRARQSPKKSEKQRRRQFRSIVGANTKSRRGNGRATLPNQTKPNQTKPNRTEPNQTKGQKETSTRQTWERRSKRKERNQVPKKKRVKAQVDRRGGSIKNSIAKSDVVRLISIAGSRVFLG